MSTVTNDFYISDKLGDTVYITDHNNGDGLCISTSNLVRNNGKPAAICSLSKDEAVSLRDWLNARYPL